MKKNVVRILTAVLMLSMVFSSSVFAAEKTSAWDSFVGLFAGSANTAEDTQVGGVTYRTHIENEGWAQGWVQDGALSGSVGKGLRLEGIEIKLQGEQWPEDLGITYRTHIQNEGWAQGWVSDGAMSGSEGKGLRLEGIEIKLTGDSAADYSVEYRTQIQNEGWAQGWVKDGEMSGSSGKGLRLEAIEIKIVQVEADLTAYEEALAAVEESDYTPASWAAYQEVVEANVVTAADTQSAVDAATEAIVAAQNELVELGKVTGVIAINATTVEVTLSEALTEIDKADFAIEGLDVTNAAIKQTDNKVVVLTTAAQVGGQIYKLSYQGVDTGLTFTGISAVLPTAIKIADGTNFVQVGQEFTVTATVTTTDANKAGIPVTFNIDAPTGSINQDIIAERYTDANGVAVYKYTRYATDIDTVSVYPTGAAAVRDVRDITWSAQPMLSVVTSETNVIANGASKTYTVTLRNRTTGNPVGAGEVIRVLFNENIGTINNTTASATDVSTAQTVVPSQRATGAATTLNLTTNASGTVTFTVTGSNTTATPIIFIDPPAPNNNNRLDATDLQLWAPAVTFQGAQISDQITVTPETEATIAASANRGRVYTMEVKKTDGTAFAGGVVQVAFNELIDNNLGTTTNANFIWYDNDNSLRTTPSNGVVAGVKAPVVAGPAAPLNRQMVVQLNDAGKATFMIANATEAQVATPIVWIDQDSTTAVTNHVLEATEPFDLGGVTVTEGQTVTSASLGINQEAQGVNTPATITYTVQDQNGAAFLPTADGDVRVTYTFNNTGANPLEVRRSALADRVLAGSWSVNGGANLVVDPIAGAVVTTINPGMSATIAVTLDNIGTTVPLVANTNFTTTLAVQAADPTAYTVSAQGLTVTTNKSLAAAAKTGTFINEVNVDAITTVAGQSVTGTITAFDTADAVYFGGIAQSGRIKISVDGQPGQFAWFTYNAGLGGGMIAGQPNDNLFVGNDSTFNANTPATNAQFESALSVGNKVRIIAAGAANNIVVNNISLYNVNATDNSSQINQTLPKTASTIIFANAGPIAKITTDAAFTNAVTGGVGTGAITYTTSNAAVATVDANTGLVTPVGVGTTTITATKAETDTHAAVTATYVVNVTLAGNIVIDNSVADVAGITAEGADGVATFNVTDLGPTVGTIVITKPNGAGILDTEDINGKTFVLDINTSDTLTVVENGNTVTIKLADTTFGGNTQGAIEALIQGLGGVYSDVTVGGTYIPGGIPNLVAGSPQTISGAENFVAAQVGVHTFTLNRLMQLGDTLTVNYNGTAYNFVAGNQFAVGASINEQAANIRLAIDADPVLGPLVNAAGAGAVVSITQVTATTTTPVTSVTTTPVQR